MLTDSSRIHFKIDHKSELQYEHKVATVASYRCSFEEVKKV